MAEPESIEAAGLFTDFPLLHFSVFQRPWFCRGLDVAAGAPAEWWEEFLGGF
jgi:hypothetical protein